jgi:hypothetical protein
MTTPNLSEAERARRSEYARESKAACARGETLEARAKQREGYANDWASWFRQRMDRSGCDDPAELLPDALAKLEQTIDDRVVAALSAFKTTLRGALK